MTKYVGLLHFFAYRVSFIWILSRSRKSAAEQVLKEERKKMKKINEWIKDQRGQTMAEYALVVVMVVGVVALVLANNGPFRDALDAAFQRVADTISPPAAPPGG